LAPPRKPRVLPPGMAHARQSAILMLVGLVASTTPLPWTAVAVVPLAWAGVESVRAIRAMSAGRAHTRSMVSVVIGLVLVCLLTAAVLLPYAVYGPAKRLQDCTDAANTAVATADCRSHFGGLESLLGGLLSPG
jgi:phosphoribosylcarboxyaminoimidazole (NCAIR) mutase